MSALSLPRPEPQPLGALSLDGSLHVAVFDLGSPYDAFVLSVVPGRYEVSVTAHRGEPYIVELHRDDCVLAGRTIEESNAWRYRDRTSDAADVEPFSSLGALVLPAVREVFESPRKVLVGDYADHDASDWTLGYGRSLDAILADARDAVSLGDGRLLLGTTRAESLAVSGIMEPDERLHAVRLIFV